VELTLWLDASVSDVSVPLGRQQRSARGPSRLGFHHRDDVRQRMSDPRKRQLCRARVDLSIQKLTR